ncbi:hypothetical protein ACFQPA_03085 [Halomarina halobia]|uniref:Uncharacterized protein n=1 Tax=Halomarina halobia TaxID=3033386 RepID=A0ABD6A4V0_9EURY|nr:hypothetical protein [Halomarina sp. PSR21]
MRHQTYGKLAALVFALILLSFVVLGFSRGIVGFRTARLLAAPTTLLAAALACFLFVRGLLSYLGIAGLR